MIGDLGPKEIKFRIVGIDGLKNLVLASVFARKFSLLIKGVEAADVAANGAKRHDYVIVDMGASSASATISERVASKKSVMASSVETYGICAEAINNGNFAVARRYAAITDCIFHLAEDVEESFSQAQLEINGLTPIVIDRIFLERATEAIKTLDIDIKPAWFKGTAIGSFDGRVLESDFRTSIPKVILRLTAGGKDIQCVCPTLTVDDIRPILTQRVRLTGRAYYDGTSGLPEHVEVIEMPVLVKSKADFTRWKSAFKSFDLNGWGDEN